MSSPFFTYDVTSSSLTPPPLDFTNDVESALHDPWGWKSYGVRFERGYPRRGEPHLRFIYTTEAHMASRGSSGFSECVCTTQDPFKTILINAQNWQTGAQSRMRLGDYRAYVIHHEVGHALGFNHPIHDVVARVRGTASGLGSIMMQMTRGPGFIYPFAMNARPLPYPMELTIQNRMKE